jgi:predicted Rossmann fold flavoprotein
MKEVIIIGAGASGLMAAIQAARGGAHVTILERNEKPLKKLLLTGNGRCNLTNLKWDKPVLRGSNVKRALGIIKKFGPEDVISFFYGIGIYTKDRDGWVYPQNDSASAVAKALLYEAERLKVRIKTNQEVISVGKSSDGGFIINTKDWKYEADVVIFSTGSTASTDGGGCGAAFETAEKYKVFTRKFLPALTGLKSDKPGTGKWAGVRADAEISLFDIDGEIAREKGQLQLTEYGVSGIPVFCLSRYAVGRVYHGKSVSAVIDFLPGHTKEEILSDVKKARVKYPDKSTKTILAGFLSEKLAQVIASNAGSDEEAAELIKKFDLDITGYLGEDKAQLCMGGIDLNDLTDELEAKECKGLYFTGEAVDIDGPCGGYNLQWAWSSGYAAGLACAV